MARISVQKRPALLISNPMGFGAVPERQNKFGEDERAKNIRPQSE